MKDNKTFWLFFTFFITALYTTLFIWQGFDMPDEGYNLANQLLITNLIPNNGVYENWLIWLSDYCGGLWLILVGNSGLIAARIGWVALMAFSTSVLFLIISRYFDPRLTTFFIICAVMIAIPGEYMVINYTNFPAFILFCASGLLTVAYEIRKDKRNRSILFSILSGVFLAFSVMARFPLIFSVILLFIPLAVSLLSTRKLDKRAFTIIPWSLLGFCIGVAFCFLILWGLGFIENYLDYFRDLFTDNYPTPKHNPSYLLGCLIKTGEKCLYRGLAIILLGLVSAMIVHYVITLVHKYLANKSTTSTFLLESRIGITSFVILFLIFLVGIVGTSWTRFIHAAPGITLLVGICALIVRYRFMKNRNNKYDNKFNLLVIAFSVSFLPVLGTTTGFKQFNLLFLFPVSFLILYECGEIIFKRMRVTKKTMQRLLIGFVCTLSIFSVIIKYSNPRYEYPLRWKLVYEITHKRMRHIYTTEGRADSMNDLLAQLDRVVKPGNIMLAYPNIPLLHFITLTIPALGEPCPNFMIPEKLEAKLEEIWQDQKKIPNVIVYSKVNMTDTNWGMKTGESKKTKPINETFFNQHKEEYALFWSNEDFEIYMLK